jgi:ubiquinone/menaquinone biosynthesis C-methylase UbiE
MINDYPNCTYEGCDIVRVVNPNINPPQFHYSHGNILERLDYDDNTFDFVHIRLLVLAIREEEWPKTLKEALRVTKPGGMIMLQETDFKVWSVILLCR